MSKPSILDTPGCLIDTTREGKLQVCEPVLEQVRQLDGPLVVVAIAGLYRTGKSYLLNRLADQKDTTGFSLGSTIESKTKGIWVWARPHPVLKDHYLLLLDTEGLGDVYKGDPNHDNWIFCLATLLSSVLCFNAKGAIDDDALKKVNFITELSKHIRTNSEEVTDADFDCFFPHFVFVLRDFFLDLEKGGREMTPDEYLEDSLQLKNEVTEQDRNYNLPRKCIRKYFKKRRCFTFGFPASGRKMKKLDTLPDTDLSPDFLEDTEVYCKYIFNEAPVKKLENGHKIQGRMWASLVETYVGAIREGKVPCVENAVVAMSIIENKRTIDHCIAMYTDMMQQIKMPTGTEKDLADHHFATLKKVLAEFMKRAVFDKETKFQQELNEKLKIIYEELTIKNEQSSEEKCHSALKVYEAPYSDKMSKGAYACSGGYALYQADMTKVKDAYNARTDLGVRKNAVLLDFLQSKWKEGQAILAADNKVAEKEKRAEEERMKAEEARRLQNAAEEAKEKAEQLAEERERAMQENIQQLETKMKEEMENERKHHEEVLQGRLDEQARLLQEGFAKESQALQTQISNLKNAMNNSRKGRRRRGKKCVIM